MADATNGATEAPSKVIEKVTMQDGRVVEFVGKRKLLKESFPEENAVRLDFRNGQTRKFVIPAALQAKFATHGAEQKLGDETAGETEVEDMVLAVDDLIERLNKGEWSIQRAGGGFAGTSVLMQALVKLTGKTADDIKAFLKDKSKAEKDALAESPKVKPVIDQIKAEKAAKGPQVDTAGLLSQIGA